MNELTATATPPSALTPTVSGGWPATGSVKRAPLPSRWGRRDAKLARLAATPVGRSLSRKELRRLGSRADIVTLSPGSSVAVGADRFAYVLADGYLAVSTADGETRSMGPGDTIPAGSVLALSEAEILVLLRGGCRPGDNG